MPYTCELGIGQRIYLDNRDGQTIVTIITSSRGQQQQASNSLSTGNWISPPAIFQTPGGAIVKIFTAGGEHSIQIQGSSTSVVNGTIPIGNSQQMQVQQIASTPVSSMPSIQPMEPMKPMKPMEPMKPMTMGDMQMSANPMEMRMGNMEMRMGSPADSGTPTSATRNFCSQCGAPVQESDRFCSSCGHRLS